MLERHKRKQTTSIKISNQTVNVRIVQVIKRGALHPLVLENRRRRATLPTLEKNLVIIIGIHAAPKTNIHTRIPDKLIGILTALHP
jgi:hypothetical protein